MVTAENIHDILVEVRSEIQQIKKGLELLEWVESYYAKKITYVDGVPRRTDDAPIPAEFRREVPVFTRYQVAAQKQRDAWARKTPAEREAIKAKRAATIAKKQAAKRALC